MNPIGVVIVGAGGYAGAELASLLLSHPHAKLLGLFASARREKGDQPGLFADLFPRFRGRSDLPVLPASVDAIAALNPAAVFLATPHEASLELAPHLLSHSIKVFDLSAAFRLKDPALYPRHYAQKLGERESVTDYGKNLERWVSLIVARVFRHSVVAELASAARVPVVNALCDLYHPCQALADYLTLWQRHGKVRGLRIAYIGDGNNVCHSLMHGAAILGAELIAITPKGHEPSAEITAESRKLAEVGKGVITVTNDPDAVKGVDAVYTDVWVSMGESAHSASERKKFLRYQINEALMAKAGPQAVFMHCLPAKRGQEVTDAIMDSPLSVVYDQAENRMHAQCALLYHMFAK